MQAPSMRGHPSDEEIELELLHTQRSAAERRQPMKRHVRTTLVYGLISALTVMPITGLLAAPIGWPMAFKLVLWLDLFFYAALLARWSNKGMSAIVFPTTLLLGTALWPGVSTGFFFLGLAVLSWIRSGSCFCGTPIRAVAAEILTPSAVAPAWQVLFSPASTITWAIGIWLFFLIQAVYFLHCSSNQTVKLPPRQRKIPSNRLVGRSMRVLENA
jgi:hypothetical protein